MYIVFFLLFFCDFLSNTYCIQGNLFQILHQLTYNMAKDFSLNYELINVPLSDHRGLLDIFLCRGVITDFFSARQDQWVGIIFCPSPPGLDRVNVSMQLSCLSYHLLRPCCVYMRNFS